MNIRFENGKIINIRLARATTKADTTFYEVDVKGEIFVSTICVPKNICTKMCLKEGMPVVIMLDKNFMLGFQTEKDIAYMYNMSHYATKKNKKT